MESKYPEMYELSQIVFSGMAMAVSVECLFSVLKYILLYILLPCTALEDKLGIN